MSDAGSESRGKLGSQQSHWELPSLSCLVPCPQGRHHSRLPPALPDPALGGFTSCPSAASLSLALPQKVPGQRVRTRRRIPSRKGRREQSCTGRGEEPARAQAGQDSSRESPWRRMKPARGRNSTSAPSASNASAAAPACSVTGAATRESGPTRASSAGRALGGARRSWPTNAPTPGSGPSAVPAAGRA